MPGAHVDEWRQMAKAGLHRFVASVKEYCLEVPDLDDEDRQLVVLVVLVLVLVDVTTAGGGASSWGGLGSLQSQVKKVPGGKLADSKCYDGVVFSGDVVNRKMEIDIDNCPLTLIQAPLTFDKDNVRTDMDALRDQEQIFLDLKVEKLVRDVLPESPKLLICQAVVSQLAQERLAKRGVAVIIGVREHILKAISRCTGSSVTKSVDYIHKGTMDQQIHGLVQGMPEDFLETKKIGGKAQRFYVNRVGHVGEEGYKALTVIEATPALKGRFSTICLRGNKARSEDLHPQAKFAKPVLQWALRLARHLQLESELLFELWCLPWRRDLEKHGDQGSDFESRPSIWEGNWPKADL
eukprot:Skav212104  [mRNA]  locus=scaffold686:118794:122572:- [translate_table: standard]